MARIRNIGGINRTAMLAVARAEDNLILIFKVLIEDALDGLISASPIFTGWYASNHRITVRHGGSIKAGLSTPKLFPREKPRVTTQGMYVSNIGSARAEELSKLSDLEVGDTVRIGTAIPYADEIEQTHSVYTGAEHSFRVR